MTSQKATFPPTEPLSRLKKVTELHSLYSTRAKTLLLLTCRDECPTTMTHLTQKTGLPYPTVYRVVNELTRMEILYEIPQWGREKLWGFNPDEFHSRGKIP